MTAEHEEGLSAYTDGELDGREGAQLAQRLLAERELRGKLGRYRLVGESLREGAGGAPVVDVTAAVSLRIADEPAILVQPSPDRESSPARAWLHSLGGAALAASVAIVAVLAAPGILNQDKGPAAPASAVSPAAVAAIPPLVDAPAMQVVAAEPAGAREVREQQAMTPEMLERLDHYLVEHHEFAGRSGLQGPVPHASFVSYEGR